MMDLVVGEESAESDEEEQDQPDETFSFRLFSSSTVAKVSIKEADDAEEMNQLAQKVAAQQVVDHDETDPVFLAKIAAATMDYDTLLKQSTWSYPTSKYPRRVLHIPATSTPSVINKPSRHKSKKRRDFEKAVQQGKFKVQPNMRDPSASPNAWPGYPGKRSPCAIIHMKKPFARPPFKTQSHEKQYQQRSFAKGGPRFQRK
ncbi:hypothetical protein DM01DRAFT_1336037 [Hesseltinella vesiculosa]|uniref:Uncharacterized protein n=1 Tax=Hesseltinella vesiculosa TaxID=101127 RepID=A0A1X2GGW2_9FUNG|nr:hypothetical protein DM01DRAFT_1336037 [Hesseltinella vesiculosa]